MRSIHKETGSLSRQMYACNFCTLLNFYRLRVQFHRNFCTLETPRLRWAIRKMYFLTPPPSLHGVLFGPLFGALGVLSRVGFVESGDLRHQGVVRVRVAQQWANRQQNLSYSEGGGPLGAQNIQTDCTIAVNIGMVYSGGEGEFGRLKRVVRGKCNV